MTLDIVQILQVGLSGFAFLLAFLSYRLISRQQSASTPRLAPLRAARWFLALCVALVVIVGVFNVMERVIGRPDPRDVASCRRALDKLDLELGQASTVEQLRIAVAEENRTCAQLVSQLSE